MKSNNFNIGDYVWAIGQTYCPTVGHEKVIFAASIIDVNICDEHLWLVISEPNKDRLGWKDESEIQHMSDEESFLLRLEKK